MNKVFVVQELHRYHCPACDSTYSKPHHVGGDFVGFKCDRCDHIYKHGVSKPRDSLTEAAVYGDMDVLHRGNKVGLDTANIVQRFRHALRNFDDEDFILPTGDPVLIGIAIALAAKANRGKVNVLKWNRETRSYIKTELEL
jgi:ribosomal protein L37AE/L43A